MESIPAIHGCKDVGGLTAILKPGGHNKTVSNGPELIVFGFSRVHVGDQLKLL